MKKSIKIAIVDSGIDCARKEFDNAKITLLNECIDNVGHGTAVTSIIHKVSPESEIFMYKLFREDSIEIDDLISTLLILKKYKFDIIHLSCGIVVAEKIELLKNICTDIVSQGTLIVSSFDNYGSISYPAAFENVIGVDWDIHCSDGFKYTYIENSPINIVGVGAMLRLPWVNGEYKSVAGASFAAAYITGIIANHLLNGVAIDDIKNVLKNNAYKLQVVDNSNYIKKELKFNIHKAILYPYNKEMHNILSYKELLDFQIMGIYESPLLRHIGMKAKDINKFGESNVIIQSDKMIPWNSDFDTVILGHTNIISQNINNNIKLEMLKNCIKYNKNIYSFDDLSEYDNLTKQIINNGNFCYFPKIDKSDVNYSYLNKLHGINTPVIGVFGTSSKQGKFSLQLSLKKILQNRGYVISGIGTEPSSLLFGMEKIFPMGYENNIKIHSQECINVVNGFMHEIDSILPDLIIVGGQSQTIPYSTGNLTFYPPYQHEFLIGTEPDAVVLCINPHDDIDYIKRTIDYLQGYINTKVIAFSLFPMSNYYEWAVYSTNSYFVNQNILYEKKRDLEEYFKIPCVIFFDINDADNIANIIVDFF